MPSRFSKTVLGSGGGQIKNLVTEGKDQPTTGGSDHGRTSGVVLRSRPSAFQHTAGISSAVRSGLADIPRRRAIWAMATRAGQLLEKSQNL